MALPLLAAGLMAGGLYGALKQKTPKMDMSAMDAAYALINKQYGQIDQYFNEAGSALDTQFGNLYGTTMQDVVNSLASSGVYDSPVSQNVMSRQQKALAETYTTAKSQLAGQKMSAIGSVDQQKIAYQQNLAQMRYQQQLAKQQKKASMFGAMGGLGGALLGV